MEIAPNGDTVRPAFLVVEFDSTEYGFESCLRSALGVEDLSQLHARDPRSPLLPNDRSALAKWSARCREKLPEFMSILTPFINLHLSRYFLTAPEVRHPPVFRIHPPGWGSISPYHKDSEYGLALGALNVWVPLTPVAGGNALWVESEEDRHDFRPIALRPGRR